MSVEEPFRSTSGIESLRGPSYSVDWTLTPPTSTSTSRTMSTAKSKVLTLRDKLSHLTYTQACRLLGADGKQLLLAGGRYDLTTNEIDLSQHGGLLRG